MSKTVLYEGYAMIEATHFPYDLIIRLNHKHHDMLGSYLSLSLARGSYHREILSEITSVYELDATSSAKLPLPLQQYLNADHSLAVFEVLQSYLVRVFAMKHANVLGNQSIHDVQLQPQLSFFLLDILIDYIFALFFEFAPTRNFRNAFFDVIKLIF